MRILITGGAGFIGSHIAEFYAPNNEITVFDNLSRTNYNIKYLKEKFPKINFINADIRDFETLNKAVKDKEVIFHTAAQVTVTDSVANPRKDYEINATGTFNVCEAARLNKINPILLFCSTNKVYGDLIPIKDKIIEKEKRYDYKDIKGVNESYPLHSNCPYGGSKICAEMILDYYNETYGIKTIKPRMSCIYGTRQFGTEDQGWVAWFTIRTLLNKPITIYGNGKQVRDVLFISDLLNAYDLLIKNINKTNGEAFNLGGGHENTISLLELLELLEKLTGKKSKISSDSWRKGDQKVYISDISKIKNYTGWEPKINVEQGVSKLINWVSDNINLFEND